MLIPQQRECNAWNYPRRNPSHAVVGISHGGSLTHSLSKNEGPAEGHRNADALVKNLLQQETLMDQAKNTRTLVKRFIGFLRMAYPMEMRGFSAAIQPRKRRSWRNAGVAFLSKNKGTGCKVPLTRMTKCTIQETTKAICTCKTPCDNAVVDTEEPDKYKLFFSNPPLCRPTTTIHPLDMLPTTNMCGHSCDCHTEVTVTDNDKEIFVGVPKSTPFSVAQQNEKLQ